MLLLLLVSIGQIHRLLLLFTAALFRYSGGGKPSQKQEISNDDYKRDADCSATSSLYNCTILNRCPSTEVDFVINNLLKKQSTVSKHSHEQRHL